jgi:hypothetical protein
MPSDFNGRQSSEFPGDLKGKSPDLVYLSRRTSEPHEPAFHGGGPELFAHWLALVVIVVAPVNREKGPPRRHGSPHFLDGHRRPRLYRGGSVA